MGGRVGKRVLDLDWGLSTIWVAIDRPKKIRVEHIVRFLFGLK